MKSLRIDRVIPGVGRIARVIESDDDVRLDMCNQAVTRLARQRKLDVLTSFKEGRISADDLFLVAFSREPYKPAHGEAGAPYLLYAVLRRDTSEVKLGTSKDIARRLRRLQGGSAAPLELLGTQTGWVEEERALHQRFAPDRLLGEWFRYTDEIAAYIREHFAPPIVLNSPLFGPLLQNQRPRKHMTPHRLSDMRPPC